MTQTTLTGPLIMGANGQIGRMLHHLWSQGVLDFRADPVWQIRGGVLSGTTLMWDVLNDTLPDLQPSAVVCLAGGPHVSTNAALAEKAVAIAQGAPVLYASTQAVYGPQTGLMSEVSPCKPAGAYGAEKLAAEHSLSAYPNATSLRIGNVIGADALLRSVLKGPVALDQFADGQGPRRMMIGPRTLGQAFIDLIALGDLQQPILNLAQPGLVAMADLLKATQADWHWVPAPDTALPSLEMDLTAIQSLIDLPPAEPAKLIGEATQAGWGQCP